MGVSNVYNQAKANAIAAIKSNMATKGTKKVADTKPDYLRMTGSIFNAPTPNSIPTLATVNTQASLTELNKKPVTSVQGKSDDGNSQGGTPSSASEGRAAAAEGEQQADALRAQTSQVQSYQSTVAAFSTSAQKTTTTISKDNGVFAKKVKAEQAQFKKDNQNIEKLVKENEEAQQEVDNAQHELDTLLARNSFSMGGTGSSSGSSDDQAKITELQTFIGAKVGVMQANGKVVYSLQRSQKKTLTRMNKANSQYVKINQKNQKAIQQQQTETSGVIKFASKVEQYSQLAQVGGQTLSMLGKLMIAAGSTPWTAWMVPVGQVMAKVGTVLELVGNYGMSAANITKTAAYAAEGNLMGAMQSAAMAVQTGVAAANSTTNFKNNFEAIDNKANQVLNKNAANKAAKEQVEQMKKNGVDFKNGMSEKDMRKSISNDLQAQMNGEKPTLNRNDLFDKNGGLTDKGKTATGTSAGKVQTEYTTQLGKDGATVKSARKATVNSFKNTASTVKKSSTSWTENFNKFSQSFNSMAQMYSMFNGGSMMGGYNTMGYANNTGKRGYAPQWNLASDPKMARIMRSNQSRRAYAV